MKVAAIYDNGGKTLDRYTVVTDEPDQPGMLMMLGLDEGGNGYSEWGSGMPGPHLGKRVRFEDLSEDTQRHIALRVLNLLS